MFLPKKYIGGAIVATLLAFFAFSWYCNNIRAPAVKVQKVAPPEYLPSDSSRASSPRYSTEQVELERVLSAKETAVDIIMNHKKGQLWNFRSYLGINFVSQYYLCLRFLGIEDKSKIDVEKLKEVIISNRNADGSWSNVPDANNPSGDTIDASVFNYWALKAMGMDQFDPFMLQSKQFILSKGGLSNCQTMTKVFLSMFGNWKWENVVNIPIFALGDNVAARLLNLEEHIGQWVWPHVMPIGYIRHFEISNPALGDEFSLLELHTDKSLFPSILDSVPPQVEVSEAGELVAGLMRRMFAIRQPRGSFGTYSVSSLLTYISMSHFSQTLHHPEISPLLPGYMEDAFKFIEWLYFDSDNLSYYGVLDDGHFWETILTATALVEAGVDESAVLDSASYLAEQQQPNGGMPYGVDFWYAPDFDDTAEVALLWALLDETKFSHNIERAVQWLLSVQNPNGGWAAFHRGREGFWLIDFAAQQFVNSAELYDPSCPDIVGHVFEAFAAANVPRSHPAVLAGLRFLEGFADDDGKMEGRWGINYIYGTGAALAGMGKLGVPFDAPWILKSVQWLLNAQNDDGGWGESPMSYKSKAWAGVGVSTPSQTAWALLGLLEAKRGGVDTRGAVEAGIHYLLRELETKGVWFDESCVGMLSGAEGRSRLASQGPGTAACS